MVGAYKNLAHVERDFRTWLTAAAAVVAKQLGVGTESVRRRVLQSQIDNP